MGPCPLNGDCRKEKSCIYSCKVTRLDTMESETYTGLTAGTFKRRYYGHNSSFNNRDARQTLSRHCWNLKDNNIQHNRQWTILAHAKPYNPVTKACRLCLKEVYYILYKPETASLNSKSEVFGWCKHRQRWTLSHAWGIKIFYFLSGIIPSITQWYYCFIVTYSRGVETRNSLYCKSKWFNKLGS